mgnify:CR=1 FL=1
MKTCIINGKLINLPTNLAHCSGFTFTSGQSVSETKSNDRKLSITDFIIACLKVGLTPDEISKLSNIDKVSIIGKLNKTIETKSSSKNKFFEYKNKKFCLSESGESRYKEIYG